MTEREIQAVLRENERLKSVLKHLRNHTSVNLEQIHVIDEGLQVDGVDEPLPSYAALAACLARVVEAATRYLHTNTGQHTTGVGHLLEQRAAAEALRADLADAEAGKEAAREIKTFARLIMDAQAVCDRPAMDTLKRLQATLNALASADSGAGKEREG